MTFQHQIIINDIDIDKHLSIEQFHLLLARAHLVLGVPPPPILISSPSSTPLPLPLLSHNGSWNAHPHPILIPFHLPIPLYVSLISSVEERDDELKELES
jgi:hypothetical protein